MTGDDHAIGGTAGRFDQYKAASPAGCVVALWECVRVDVVHLSRQSADERAGGRVRGRRVRSRAPRVDRREDAAATNWTPASLESVMTSQLRRSPRSTRAFPRPRHIGSTASAGATGRRWPKTELAHGIRFDTNYYHYPAAWIGRDPGLHDRLRDDHAVRRPRRNTDRRLPGSHAHERRGLAAVSRRPSTSSSTRRSGRRATTACSP